MKRWLTLAALLLGCSPALVRQGAAPSPPPSPPSGQAVLQAGVAEVDITPPAGLSLFGHGPDGRISRGHRGRLRCRSLFAIDARGESVAWSVCDLAAPSSLLQRRVADRTLRAIGLGADRFVLSATHTHAGPAHYFGSKSYTGPLSTEAPGFDEGLLNWLAARIASSVVQARNEALAGGEARLSWSFGEMKLGLTKNRSLEPHCKNAQPMGDKPSHCAEPDEKVRAAHEVDRELSVLRVERGPDKGRKTIGLFAVLSMHPTTIPNTNEVYHADVFGLATRRLQRELVGNPIVAIANGIEGDVSPNVEHHTEAEAAQGVTAWSEAEQLAAKLAADIKAAAGAAGKLSDDHIERVYREVDLSSVECGEACLCLDGAVGNAAAGGAEDGRTRLYPVSIAREGAKLSEPHKCHRFKRAWTAPLTEGPWAFPSFVPLQLVRIGGALLVTLPFEMTTTPGIQLRERLVQESGERVVLVGLSNEYLQYVTTEQEYDEQHYEGASVIYGPKSAAYFGDKIQDLLAGLAVNGKPHGETGQLSDLNFVLARAYNPEERICRFVPAHAEEAKRELFQQPYCVAGAKQTVAIEWTVADDDGEADIASGALVTIQQELANGWQDVMGADGAPVDDTGTSLWVKRRREEPTHYLAVWQAPSELPGKFRFKVGHKTHVFSADFALSSSAEHNPCKDITPSK